MPDLLRIAEAAAEFRVHRVTLYRYVKNGRLTGYRRGLGSGTYVDRDELKVLDSFQPVAVARKR